MTLAKKYGVPFVADFRDPWLDNPNFRHLAYGFLRKVKSLERSNCVAASQIITISTELSDQFQLRYPEFKEKIVIIANGFDRHAQVRFDPTQNENKIIEEVKLQKLEICYFGTVYGKRNLFPIIQAIYELIEEGRILGDQFRLRFVGYWSIAGEETGIIRELEARGVLTRIPAIPHDKCFQEMRHASVLLILQSDSPTQIPGKLYEYVSMGKPILAVGDSGATSALIDKHQLGHFCPSNVSLLKQLLVGLISRQDQIPSPPTEVVDQFHYRFLTKQLASVLDSIY